MAKRDYIPYSERLAAALACLLPSMRRDELRRHNATADDVIAHFHFDHIRLHALESGDPDVDKWFNLDPKLVQAHREKSRIDTGIVAKVKRLQGAQCKHCGGSGIGCCPGAFSEVFNKKQEKFRQRVLSPIKRKRKTQSRWPKRKLRSQGFRRHK